MSSSFKGDIPQPVVEDGVVAGGAHGGGARLVVEPKGEVPDEAGEVGVAPEFEPLAARLGDVVNCSPVPLRQRR